ncbi:uncharacterized protein LOC120352821 [Nilaparvata lugens]|uniref:uncharacterized protein LOC120352821 n=1 Tax=Nilaparvata lugens TaxID=108931 RepID=UPI00193DE7F8|nr:uncharacterized protein LOC120352821 [Nilaparvata lugens]
MNFTTEDEKTYLQQKSCCLCTKPIDFIDRVRHHSHSTGKFIGAAHNTCNLNTKKVEFIPVIFHNLTGYDMHFILKSLGNYRKKISTIAKSSEKIMTMTLNNTLRFIDSLNSLHSSLDKLVAINPEFKLLQQHYPPNKIDLLRKQQLYPYEYMNNFQKFLETKLPTIDKFYSSIGDKNATVEWYDHAKTVWEVFKIENLAQFHDFYLKIDILLLADVFENFRKMFMNTYNMDVAHCYSLPHFSRSAMLKYTKVELQLISDPDQYLFFEKGIRGGISIIPHHYAKANNRYMNDFKINEPETNIIYWDCNNLYAVGMCCNLPHSNFEWMTEAEIQEFNVEQDQSNVGYVLEVDLEYPRHLHNSHNDYPLAPVKEKPPNGKTEKLLTTLKDKEKYIIHINNLKLYLRLGMKLKKIHRGIKFLQSKWLEPFINLNTQLRRNAHNDFERNLYKLMNNSVYGRTLMNVKKHSDFEIVTNEKRLHKLISKPRTKNWHLFGENVVGVTLNKVEIVLNKPIYVGMVILEESKAVMFDFHYNYIKKIFPNQSKVLMSDTDIFMYSIECDDIYEKIKIHGDIFDTSNYKRNHMFYNN